MDEIVPVRVMSPGAACTGDVGVTATRAALSRATTATLIQPNQLTLPPKPVGPERDNLTAPAPMRIAEMGGIWRGAQSTGAGAQGAR